MSGGDVVGADAVGVVGQAAELQPVVAHDAWIGRAASRVLVDEVVDDVLLKLVLEVNDVVRDADSCGSGTGVLLVLDAAAVALATEGVRVGVGPEAHRDADNVEALTLEQGGSGSGVHTAAHTDEDTGSARRVA